MGKSKVVWWDSIVYGIVVDFIIECVCIYRYCNVIVKYVWISGEVFILSIYCCVLLGVIKNFFVI